MATVTNIGDAVLTNSIIDRSITEIDDALCETVGTAAFRNCKALVSAKFDEVTTVGSYAFCNCSALKTSDFPTLATIGANAFYGCTSLEALILRRGTVCSLASGALDYSSIANGTGYIYVPSVLVGGYKAATPWSAYSNQIRAIEDYPQVCSYYGKAWKKTTLTTGCYHNIKCIDGVCIAIPTSGTTAGSARSTDNGETWKKIYSSNGWGLTAYGLNLLIHFKGLWMLCSNYLEVSEDEGNTWQRAFTDSTARSICCNDSLCVLGADGGLYYSEDGRNWTQTELGNVKANSIAYGGGVWMARISTDGGSNYSVYSSTDAKTWTKHLATGSINTLHYVRGKWFGVGNYNTYTLKGETTWIQDTSVPYMAGLVYADDDIMYACRSNTATYYSEDGQTWIQNNFSKNVYAINRLDNGMYIANTFEGVFYSWDAKNWEMSDLRTRMIYGFAVAGDALLVGTDGLGVYRSDGTL